MSREYHNFHQQSEYAQLVRYIRRGQVSEVSVMLDKTIASGWSLLRQRDRANRTALHQAADCETREDDDDGHQQQRQLKIVVLILRAASSREILEAQDVEGNTALHLAVINGNCALVRILLERMSPAQVNIADYELHTAVHWAVVCGQLACLQLLLEGGGALVDTPDIYGAHPLHYATQLLGDHQFGGRQGRRGTSITTHRHHRGDTLRLLHHLLAIRLQLDVNCVDNEARTPLIWAASSGNHEALHSLVKAGAEIGQQDKEGLTALHCASSRGHYKCVSILVMICGADVHQTDTSGCTPLFYATALGHADCVRLLIESGAHLDHQDNKGRTAAHCGASKGQLETLRILHEHGANLWLKNVRGDLPLHEAVKSGRKDLVRWLLDLNRKAANEVNLYGRSALHIAAFNNNVELCRLLIEEHSADANSVMKVRSHYLTPLDAAHQNAADEVAEYLHGVGGRPIAKINQQVDEYINFKQSNNTNGSELTNKQLDHFVGFDSSLEESEDYRQLRKRYSNNTKATKLPNLVPPKEEEDSGQGERTKAMPRALSNADSDHSVTSSPKINGRRERVTNVRQFDQQLDIGCGHQHLRQAIITNVYLTTNTSPTIVSPNGHHRRTPAPLGRRATRKAASKKNGTRVNGKVSREKSNAGNDEQSEEDEEEGGEDTGIPVKVTIDARDTFISTHETREDRMEVEQFLAGTTTAGGTAVHIESLTRTGLESEDSELDEAIQKADESSGLDLDKNKKSSPVRDSQKINEKEDETEENETVLRKKRSLSEEENGTKQDEHIKGDVYDGREETNEEIGPLSMITEEGEESKSAYAAAAAAAIADETSNKTSRQSTFEDKIETKEGDSQKRNSEQDDDQTAVSTTTNFGGPDEKTEAYEEEEEDDEDRSIQHKDIDSLDEEKLSISDKSIYGPQHKDSTLSRQSMEEKDDKPSSPIEPPQEQNEEKKKEEGNENEKDKKEYEEADDLKLHNDDDSVSNLLIESQCSRDKKIEGHRYTLEEKYEEEDNKSYIGKDVQDYAEKIIGEVKEEEKEAIKVVDEIEKETTEIVDKGEDVIDKLVDETRDEFNKVVDNIKAEAGNAEDGGIEVRDQIEEAEDCGIGAIGKAEADVNDVKDADIEVNEEAGKNDGNEADDYKDDGWQSTEEKKQLKLDENEEEEVEMDEQEEIVGKRSISSLNSLSSVPIVPGGEKNIQEEGDKQLAEVDDDRMNSTESANDNSKAAVDQQEQVINITSKQLRRASVAIQNSSDENELDGEEEQPEKMLAVPERSKARRGSVHNGHQQIENNQRAEVNANEDQSGTEFKDNETYLREDFDDEDGELSDAPPMPARKVNRQYAHIGPKVDTFRGNAKEYRQLLSKQRYLKSSNESLNRVSKSKSVTKGEDYHQIDPAIIQQTVEKYIRKYYLERKLFEELHDLKRYQIRTGRSNEPQMVKRLVEKFRHDTRAPGMAEFKGPYTYRAYEMFLYDKLRHLSRSNDKKIAYLTKSISLEDFVVNNTSGSSYEGQYDHPWEARRGEATSDEEEKQEHQTRLEYEKQEAGTSVDYKYEYHKSQHYDKRTHGLVDVTLENLYKRTGLDGHKFDEMAITRKLVERKHNKQAADLAKNDGHHYTRNCREADEPEARRQQTKNRKSDKKNDDKSAYYPMHKTKMTAQDELLASDSGVVDSGGHSDEKANKVGKLNKLSIPFHDKLNQRKSMLAMANTCCSTSTSIPLDAKQRVLRRRRYHPSVVPARRQVRVPPGSITARWEPIKTARRRQLWTSHGVDDHGNVLLWYEINKPWHHLRSDELHKGEHSHRYAVDYAPPFEYYHRRGDRWPGLKLHRTHSDTELALCVYN